MGTSKAEQEHLQVFGETVADTQTTGISSTNLIDRNAVLNISLLLISFYGMFISKSILLSLTWISFLIIEDVLFFMFGISLFDTNIGIKRGYQFGHIFLNDISGHGRDLGFNLYDGDLNKTLKQSQVDKYKYMIDHLGIKPGMKVLDCGCGYGDWLNYLKNEMKCDVVGINITPEQANFAREHYGLTIYNINWNQVLTNKEIQLQLYNKFDVVTFMDTVEHYVSSKDRNNATNQAKIYSNMFYMAHNLLNPKSKLQKIFISCLHQNGKFIKKSLTWQISAYFLTRYHSGFYPKGSNGLTKHGEKYFNVIQQIDKTEDYRLTAVLDDKQFQAPKLTWTIKKVFYSMMFFFLDPHHIHKIVDIYYDAWMNVYGEDPYSKEYNVKERANKSYVLLWWITMQDRRVNQKEVQ